MTDNRPGPGGVAHMRTTLWLGNSDDVQDWNGHGFEVSREDNMVWIQTMLEDDRYGHGLEVFIMRDLFPKIREAMDRVDGKFRKPPLGEDAREALFDALEAADDALGGDSNDAEHDALYDVREIIAGILGVEGDPPEAADSVMAGEDK